MARQPSTPDVFIELVRVQPHNIGAFRLKDVTKLPNGMGQAAQLENPLTGELFPVPYGSLENYARRLATEWGDDTIYVQYSMTILNYNTDKPPEHPDPDEADKSWHEYVASLPPEQQVVLKKSLREQLEAPDTAQPDLANPDAAPNAC